MVKQAVWHRKTGVVAAGQWCWPSVGLHFVSIFLGRKALPKSVCGSRLLLVARRLAAAIGLSSAMSILQQAQKGGDVVVPSPPCRVSLVVLLLHYGLHSLAVGILGDVYLAAHRRLDALAVEVVYAFNGIVVEGQVVDAVGNVRVGHCNGVG